ncbi:MAG: hypothetical protein AUI63_08945 [Gemmatimonadetes bacterium 13_1_40CM_2_60_3]|nr:MAG: hypothetical protein AUI63_08945 [Gemmatimonadetes bacterium 13_1_40CM_2_60_3]
MVAERLVAAVRPILSVVPEDIRRSAGVSIRVAPFAAAVGVAVALLWPEHYLSTASFIAESQNLRALPSALGALADQFGIVGGAPGAQSPAFFADLLESRAILLPVLSMSTTTTDDDDPKPLIERLGVGGPERKDREERGLRKLRNMLVVTPDAKTSVVTFGVDARDPQMAYHIAQALIKNLDQFNVTVRRSRARNEREFLDGRVSDAKNELQAAEQELEQFLASNRGDTRSSPSLAFREARLKRRVDLAQTRFLELQRQLDQARLQEVRDTPVITVLDAPDIPQRHYRPRRGLVTITVLLLGMVAAYAYSRLTGTPREVSRTATGAVRPL